MNNSDELKFKYDQYEDDFHKQDQNDKNMPVSTDFNMQTTPKSKHKGTEGQQQYQQDFVEASHNESELKNSELKLNSSQSNQAHKKQYENNPNRQKMIQQNIKLKTQIYELAKQMDDIMQREKKQKKYGIHADEEEDQTLKAKKQELKKQQIEIMNLKNKIFLTKRQLEHVYDSRGIQGKQDELKNLQKQLKVLQDQKDALIKVKREQSKALKLIRNDNQYEQKMKALKDQLAKTKDECKHLSEKLLQNERILRKNHELYIIKQSKVKDMETKIKEAKEKAKKGTANQNQSNSQTQPITQEMINEIDEQINELQKQRKEAEKSWNEKISTIESQLQQRRLQEEKKLLILRQKQKQLKLNQIRIKQLKKLINHHTTEAPKKPQQQDMKEFRHKRNIKQMEK